MDTRQTLLQALHDDPGDDVTWLALADWLEENAEADRAELIRLHRSLPRLRAGKKRYAIEERIQEVLASGVKPCVPTLTNSIGLELALIPAGTFRMGSPPREPRRMDDEKLHSVRITKPFYLGVYPVTQGEFRAVMRSNPSAFNRRTVKDRDVDLTRCPVESVTWTQAVAFCSKLSERPAEKAAGRVYRLPSEAEWEYACRAWGSPLYPFHLGKTLDTDQANFRCSFPYPPDDELREVEALGRTCEVGWYAANAFGLYDMHGNVDEWVQDYYQDGYYEDSPEDNPPGPNESTSRLVRGGSWGGQGEDCRAAVRIGYEEDYESDRVGLRVAMTIATK
jgi:uncharacterized protein (TIGR02996 family)